MDSSNTSRRRRQLARWLTAALAGLPLVFVAPVRADLIDQRNEMIAKFVNDMHADPLVADCAAHASFVASTSNIIDHVEFTPEAFDGDHATIKPWNEPFDAGKQRIKVDNIVSVGGQGIARDKDHAPYELTFRCGYVGQQMLAFSWNDPEPSAKPRPERPAKKRKGKHGATKHAAAKKTTNGRTQAQRKRSAGAS
ncbi:MAG TPA: hypothetical protein VNZ04_09730 [Trinickia sp.]|jgi:hypothetical protein|nr:hypothetical protein [Trinickia sp.]